MPQSVEQELLTLNARLLESIGRGDWATYTKLCDPTLTCFEPEALGHIVDGMDFHKFYFDLPRAEKPSPRQTQMTQPHVRLMGDVAVVSYIRLTQFLSGTGEPVTSATEETRVWQKQGGDWKHVHFHRSPANR